MPWRWEGNSLRESLSNKFIILHNFITTFFHRTIMFLCSQHDTFVLCDSFPIACQQDHLKSRGVVATNRHRPSPIHMNPTQPSQGTVSPTP